jgi:hypothetical protein
VPRIKIFISHSTKTNESQVFLDAVKRALEDDFEVCLDQIGLHGGDDWRAKICQWMDEVHGAVLMLTPEALESEFVQFEASVLSWRRLRQPKFVLIPVLVGVNVDALERGIFGKLALERIQAVSLDFPEALGREIHRCLLKLKGKEERLTAREQLVLRASKCLRMGGLTGDDLLQVGLSELGWPEADWSSVPEDYRYENFASRLLDADIATICTAVRHLVRRGLRGAAELLDVLAPFWVAEKDAKPIAWLALSDDSERVVSLNGLYSRTAEAYITRSCGRPIKPEFPIYHLVPPSDEDELADFRQQILSHLSRGRCAVDVAAIKRQLKMRDDSNVPVFVVFPADWAVMAETVEGLRAEFKTITFFILTGDAPPERLGAQRRKIYTLDELERSREEEANDYLELTYLDIGG